MMIRKLIFIIVLVSFAFTTAYSGDSQSADIEAATVDKCEGKVRLHAGGSVRGEDSYIGHTIFIGDTLRTGRKSTAAAITIDNSKVVLMERSSVEFLELKEVAPGEGKVIFDIEKQESAKGMQVKLMTTVIGVKGTQFMVDLGNASDTDTGEMPPCRIYLREGELEFTSLEGEFRRYVQEEMAAFKKFVDEEMSEFEAFKKEFQGEKVEHVKSFDLKAGEAVSIDGKDVRNIKFSEDAEEAFRMLDEL
ncbi:FecR domain-containing protein [Limisalsivibrio acetivorans]|uniref:FecR domain-containing protein n=1 Tax=Limisalsivibrio acetivorans TaxID=1304888 RepID=UPI0003B59F75|nr:FecR domain-containing protein [Limisalsivibrio acetivorans]